MPRDLTYIGFPPLEGQLVDAQGRATDLLQDFLHGLWRKTGGSTVAVQQTGVLLISGGQTQVVPVSSGNGDGGTVPTTGSSGGQAQAQSLAGSPFVFNAGNAGTLVVDGGKVEIGRDGAWYCAGLAGGALPLVSGDSARVTWFAGNAPAVVWLPRA